MAKFILDKVTIGSTSNFDGTGGGDIHAVIVEASLPTIEPNTVVVDDGQTINESYTVNIEMRTKHTRFDATDNGGVILTSAVVSNDGTLHTKAYIKFHGATSSFNIETGQIYLNGYEDFSNGRRETVLTGTLEVISAASGLTSS
jgi:hypothetical protein